MNNTELYNHLLSVQPEKRMVVAIEELSELQKELSKYLRNKLDKSNLLEEYVDVLIMMEQIKLLFDFQNKDIEMVKNYKLNRLQERYTNNNL